MHATNRNIIRPPVDCFACGGLGCRETHDPEALKIPMGIATHAISLVTRDNFDEAVSFMSIGHVEAKTTEDLNAVLLILHGQAQKPPKRWMGRLLEVSEMPRGGKTGGKVVFRLEIQPAR